MKIKDFVRGAFWIGLSTIFGKIINMGAISVMAFLVSMEDVGVYTVINSFLFVFTGISNLGLSLAVQRKIPNLVAQSKRLSIVIASSLATFIAISSIALAAMLVLKEAFLSGYFDGILSIKFYYAALFFYAFFAASEFLMNYLVAFKDFKTYSTRSLIFSLSFFFSISVGGMHSGLDGIVMALPCGAFINLMYSISVFLKTLNRNDVKLRISDFNINVVFSLFREGFPYYMGNTLMGAISTLVTIGLLTHSVPLADIGVLRIGQSYAAVITVLPSIITPLTISTLSSRLKQPVLSDNIKRFQVEVLILFLSIVFFALILFGPELISLLFGAVYADGLLIVYLVLFYSKLSVISIVFSNFLVAAGEGYKFMYISTVGVLVHLLTTMIFINDYHIYAYLYGLIIGQVVGLLWVIKEEVRLSNTAFKSLVKILPVILFVFVAGSFAIIFDAILIIKLTIFLAFITFLFFFVHVRLFSLGIILARIKSLIIHT